MKITTPLILVVALFLTVMLRQPYSHSGFLSNDEGVYTTNALVLSKGGFLFRDAFDHKPPGFNYLYYWILSAADFRMSAVRYVFTLLIALHILAFHALMRDHFPAPVALAQTLLIAILPNVGPFFDFQAAHPEIPMMVFATMSLTFLNVATRQPPSGTLCFLSGVFWGCSFQMKQAGITLIVPLLYLLLVRIPTVPTGSTGTLNGALIRLSTCFIAGFSIILVISVTPFAIHGALGDFTLGFFQYNRFYFHGMNLLDMAVVNLQSLQRLFSVSPVVYFAAAIGLIVALRQAFGIRSDASLVSESRRARFVLLWFASSLIGALLGKKGFLHYYIQLLPPIAVLSFYPVLPIFKLRIRAPALITSFVLTAFAATDAIVHQSAYSDHPAQSLHSILHPGDSFQYVTQPRAQAIADYIRLNTSPSDRIFVWGFFPQLYALSERLPATRFSFCQPLIGVDIAPDRNAMPEETRLFMERLQTIAASEFETHLPAIVIDTAPVGFWGWKDAPLTTIDRIGSLVRERYDRTTQFWGMDVYRLRQQP